MEAYTKAAVSSSVQLMVASSLRVEIVTSQFSVFLETHSHSHSQIIVHPSEMSSGQRDGYNHPGPMFYGALETPQSVSFGMHLAHQFVPH